MADLLPAAVADLAWPIVLALAWLVGELGHRWLNLPRISLYGLVGFVFGHAQMGVLPPAGAGLGTLLAGIAFGLILFEFGYRINLRWLRINPWLGASGLAEALATFAAVYLLARLWGSPNLTALLLASLAMSTSPAAILRVINEQRSTGQVTERILHLSALNCVLSLFAFKVIVGFWTFQSSGNLWLAVFNSLVVLGVSAGLGALFGVLVTGLLRRTGRLGQDGTVAFAIAVILLVGLAHAFKYSSLLATLVFGLVARQRRVTLTQTQRNFGALGDLLAVVLFAYVAATIEWPRVATGLALGLALVGVRLASKSAAVALLARVSGISWRKGFLTGLALMPLSVFVILLLEEHALLLGIDLVDQLAPLAAATLLLELLAPVTTQLALRWAGETSHGRER